MSIGSRRKQWKAYARETRELETDYGTDQGGKVKRIPTLDGWRGLAVLIVQLFHYQLYFMHYFLTYSPAWIGEHGVNIFFVVSGYLITATLLRRDKIDFKRFYVRRFFRLMPAAW